MRQVIAQSLGHREHPLPHRQSRNDVLGEVRGGLDHASGGAGRTDAATFAGVGDQEVMAAIGTAGARKTVGEDAALKIPAEFALGKCRGAATLLVIVQRQPGG